MRGRAGSRLAAADVHRPAAIRQLQVLGSPLNIEVFTLGDKVDPADIAAGAMERAKSFGYDTVILDTAGRLHIDDEMMELERYEPGSYRMRSCW